MNNYTPHNNQFCIRQVEVQTKSFVLLFKCSVGCQYCAPKSFPTQIKIKGFLVYASEEECIVKEL